MDTTEIESKWESEGYAVDVERKTFPPHLSTPPHSHPFDARVLILAGAFTLTSQGQSRTYYPESISRWLRIVCIASNMVLKGQPFSSPANTPLQRSNEKIRVMHS